MHPAHERKPRDGSERERSQTFEGSDLAEAEEEVVEQSGAVDAVRGEQRQEWALPDARQLVGEVRPLVWLVRGWPIELRYPRHAHVCVALDRRDRLHEQRELRLVPVAHSYADAEPARFVLRMGPRR